tara:strand:- start:942 stop:2459 length:1518 start_codon:yes stop_codon:yes gene_type:complete
MGRAAYLEKKAAKSKKSSGSTTRSGPKAGDRAGPSKPSKTTKSTPSKSSQRQPGLVGSKTAKKIQKKSRDFAKEARDRELATKDSKQGFLSKIGHGPVEEDYIGDEAFKKTQPAGQHKLRSQFDRLSAKYGPDFAKTSQGQHLLNYLSGVAVERGGGLGARDPEYGGLTSYDQLDPDSEAYRQSLLDRYSGIGSLDAASRMGKDSNWLRDIDIEKARGNLTPDQYFKFRQQLMAADPTPGNMQYKKAFPFSSGQALEGIMQMAPGIGTAGRFLKGALGKAQDVGQGIAQNIPKGLLSLLNKAKGVATPEREQVGGGDGQQFAYQQESMYPQGYGDFLINPPSPTRPGAGGPTIQGFPDQDGDGIDDRWQAGPGQARPGIEQLPDQGQGVIGGMPGISQPGYGGSVGQENQMRTADFVDRDGDRIDDRDQAGPGQPHWRGSAGQGQKFVGNIPMAPSAITPGSALAMSPITQQLQFQQPNQIQFQQPNQQPNANWQQWNQNLRRFS